MKVTDLDINGWQRLVDQFRASSANKKIGAPVAIRCENTQLSIARHYGGGIYNGERYTFFAPLVPGEKCDDGSPYHAWLVVRDDFLRWAAKELKKGEKK